jgi:3-(3-hydroxy-phenyl)propionate hydroxylase
VLTLPQSTLETLLLDALATMQVEVKSSHQASTIEQSEQRVQVRIVRREVPGLGASASDDDPAMLDSSLVGADFVVGADGYDSRVRAGLGIDTVRVGGTESFAMFEFQAPHDAGQELQLGFSDELCSMMIPLPGDRVRWGFQLAEGLSELATSARLDALLTERAPWYGYRPEQVDWSTVIHFERRLARGFGQGRVWLAGDAAHVTSPIGAQSMNVGLCEAHDLVSRIADCVEQKTKPETLSHYGLERQREWHKLMGINVSFDVLPHAPSWLWSHARRVVPLLPASGAALQGLLSQLGLVWR